MSLTRRTICFTWRHLSLTRMQMCISKKHMCLTRRHAEELVQLVPPGLVCASRLKRNSGMVLRRLIVAHNYYLCTSSRASLTILMPPMLQRKTSTTDQVGGGSGSTATTLSFISLFAWDNNSSIPNTSRLNPQSNQAHRCEVGLILLMSSLQ